ncbi:MAG: WbuC family cupin fold metalloprotein [Bacteroidales bacterium]|nr:WbuC family cupin fold metalloprotein [Bacteroidales bacterium]
MGLEIIDQELLDRTIRQAQTSPRLRMNFNFHSSLNDKCQRMLNALEPGTVMPVHVHQVDEVYVILQGRLEAQACDEKGNVVERVVLDPKEGRYGVQIPAGTWHSLEVMEQGTVIFEVKEGPFIPHEKGGMVEKTAP